jgi:hypothetical protein
MKALWRFIQLEMKSMIIIEQIEHSLKVDKTKISNVA